MKLSNCLIWSFRLWWRRGMRGGVTFLKSDWGNFPHAVYMERHHVVHYVPIHPKKRLIPPPLFLGKVKWGHPKFTRHSAFVPL